MFSFFFLFSLSLSLYFTRLKISKFSLSLLSSYYNFFAVFSYFVLLFLVCYVVMPSFSFPSSSFSIACSFFCYIFELITSIFYQNFSTSLLLLLWLLLLYIYYIKNYKIYNVIDRNIYIYMMGKCCRIFTYFFCFICLNFRIWNILYRLLVLWFDAILKKLELANSYIKPSVKYITYYYDYYYYYLLLIDCFFFLV